MEILLAVGLMALCFLMLGLGLLLARKKNCVQGSCGGIGKTGNPDISCPSCEGDPRVCPEKSGSSRN